MVLGLFFYIVLFCCCSRMSVVWDGAYGICIATDGDDGYEYVRYDR